VKYGGASVPGEPVPFWCAPPPASRRPQIGDYRHAANRPHSGGLRKLHQFTDLEIAAKVDKVIQRLGLGVDDLLKVPHQFSGGQRQRIGIASALTVDLQFVDLDEFLSALDVSVQAQVADLWMEIHSRYKIDYLFISHNLAFVEYICDRVIILYLGKIVGAMNTPDRHLKCVHTYTRELIDSIPMPDPCRVKTGMPLLGKILDPMNLQTHFDSTACYERVV